MTLTPSANSSSLAVHLRPYQVAAVDALKQQLAERHRTLIVQPTGSGKTIVAGHVLHSFKLPLGTLTLVHRDELITQTVQKLMMCGVDRDAIGVVKAERNELGRRHTVASIQTVWRDNRLKALLEAGPYGLVWVDEAHHSVADTYQKVLKAVGVFESKGPRLFGTTATSDRMDGKGLGGSAEDGGVFETIAYQIKMLPLIQQGYLTDVKALRVTMPIDLKTVKMSRGDFSDQSLGEAMLAAKAPLYIAAAIAEHARGRRIACFTPTVEVAYATAQAIRDEDFSVETVVGETPPDERRKIYAALADGKLDAISSVMVLTEGWDEPSVDCIAMARPTQSRSLYQQIIGRGLRPFPDKEHCLVLDLVGNTDHKRLETAASLLGREIDAGNPEAGLDPEELEELGLLGALEEEFRRQKEKKNRLLIAAEAEAIEVDILARVPLKWTKPTSGLFMINLGKSEADGREQGYVAVERVGSEYRALRLHPNFNYQGWVQNYGVEVLGDGLDQGYALGVAGDIARELVPPVLLDRNAKWRKRQDPPTDGQMRLLEKWNMGVPETKAEASEMIDVEIARRAWSRTHRPAPRMGRSAEA